MLLLVLAFAIGRDLWFRWGENNPENSWVAATLRWLASYPVNLVAVALGIAVSLAGLWMIIAALSPRVRTHARVASPASVWIRPVDMARKSTHLARTHAGDGAINSRATRMRVRVAVEDDGTGTELKQRIEASLIDEFSPLQVQPRVTVALLPQQADPTSEDEQ
ncbi:hypothetical protein [Corynebacterium qintianiae]|uniref:hypothetical protein n=1 Tax=Corynebacterium qintianiae TaxID=2709392 RepID=UPI001F18EA63|nr:hypothetical protein [Corynebacterium qintianiae]